MTVIKSDPFPITITTISLMSTGLWTTLERAVTLCRPMQSRRKFLRIKVLTRSVQMLASGVAEYIYARFVTAEVLAAEGRCRL